MSQPVEPSPEVSKRGPQEIYEIAVTTLGRAGVSNVALPTVGLPAINASRHREDVISPDEIGADMVGIPVVAILDAIRKGALNPRSSVLWINALPTTAKDDELAPSTGSANIWLDADQKNTAKKDEIKKEPIVETYLDGRLVIDKSRYEISLDGELKDLTPTEYKILELLANRVNSIVSYQDLSRLILHEKLSSNNKKTLQVHISTLRKAFGADGLRDVITSKHKKGYMFIDESKPRIIDRMSPSRRLAFRERERAAYLDGLLLDLTPHEYEILDTLMYQVNRVIEWEEMYRVLYGNLPKDIKNSRQSIVREMSNLRKKLGDYGAEIKTITNIGYMLNDNEDLQIEPRTFLNGRLEIDYAQRVVKVDNEIRHLRPFSFDMLMALAENQGNVVNNELLFSTRNKGENPTSLDSRQFRRRVQTHIHSLRASLGPIGVYVKAFDDLGYIFIDNDKHQQLENGNFLEGHLKLDILENTVGINGEINKISPLSTRILSELLLQPNIFQSSGSLYIKCWGKVPPKTAIKRVSLAMVEVKKILGPYAAAIQNKYARGYLFDNNFEIQTGQSVEPE